MQYLSYSTIKELIEVPHSYINKQMGLERRKFFSMEQGTSVHRIVQAHVVGHTAHPLLTRLPTFDTVELKDMDERCRIDFLYEDFHITGFFDGFDTTSKNLLEIKSSSTPWSLSKFMATPQWRFYVLGLKYQGIDVEGIFFATMPRDITLWSERSVKVFWTKVNDEDIKIATDYIDRAITIIKNISELAHEDNGKRCMYIGCPFGCTNTPEQQ